MPTLRRPRSMRARRRRANDRLSRVVSAFARAWRGLEQDHKMGPLPVDAWDRIADRIAQEHGYPHAEAVALIAEHRTSPRWVYHKLPL